MPKPDFFIVGAPRCGTTAMYEYLREHPQVFMPEHKEPIYFGDDLTHLHGRLDRGGLPPAFQAGTSRAAGRRGEYVVPILAESAASEIREFAPDAQIVAMFRDPVEVMYSLHRELVFYNAEPIHDFKDALDAEEDRKQGRRLGPPGRGEMLHYRDIVRFADQLGRFLAEFDRDRIKVIIYDDFASDPAAAYRDLLGFLGVDDTFSPTFERVNESKRQRFPALTELIVRPPAPIARLVPKIRRTRLAHQVRAAILAANSMPTRRAPMPADLRRQLTQEYATEVARLGRLIGRDLSHWSRVDADLNAPSSPIKAAIA